MGKIKSFLHWSYRFTTHNIAWVLIVLVGLWFFWPESDPIYRITQNFSRGASYDYAIEESYAMDMDDGAGYMAKSLAIAPTVLAEGFDPEAGEQKLIKNASLTIEVPDTEFSKEEVANQIKKANGYITNINSYQVRAGVLAYNMTVRIPVEKLDEVFAQVAALGEKTAENFSIQDITAQYRDNEARLANLKARQIRLREMMERDTEDLSDVLKIDKELNEVTLQIENLERTQRNNDNDVAYSRLTISIQPEPQIGDITNPQWTTARSWKEAVNRLIDTNHNTMDRLILALVFAPYWIPFLIVVFAVQRFVRRRQRNKAAKK